jgi:phosphate transport system protein
MSHALRPTFDRELNEIHSQFLEMAHLVDQAIEQAMDALEKNDRDLAATVIAGDVKVNVLRFKIEEQCMTVIATQQPVAGDLRSLIAVMHGVLELERMGDHATGIAKIVIRTNSKMPAKPVHRLEKMAKISREMLADCMQAFIKQDSEWAKEIAGRDALMDRMHENMCSRLIHVMSKRPTLITKATYLIWCAHNLERIADRVTNLSEQVIFMTTGEMTELNQ